MEKLSPAERELVAIGASVASNCIPCVTYHMAKAKKLGLSDAQIMEAVELADKVRQVPARAVLEAVQRDGPADEAASGCGCAKTGAE
ncbi:MAG TPA: alkylhydroperoxidase AhpD family core domain protein [Gallionellaceae bacterium]|nr:alkylhydroperoxidase AhpD family core domain protein [Gallionellaceae bacterium]